MGVRWGISEAHEYLQNYSGQGNALTFHNSPKQERTQISVHEGLDRAYSM